MQKDIYKSDYYYNLPGDLVAKYPVKNRTSSKLLHLDGGDIHIDEFISIQDELKDDDILIINETKVIPARLKLKKQTGGSVELLVLDKINKTVGNCLTKGLNKKIKEQTLYSDNFPVKISILNVYEDSVEIKFNQAIDSICDAIGHIPIPPYLNRSDEELDRDRYQSVFANDKHKNSVAAPTASLHFDNKLMEQLEAKLTICKINLDIGLGTFKPLKDEPITNKSKLHKEDFYISESSATVLNDAISADKRLVALGTTTLRALESAYDVNVKKIRSGPQSTEIFIHEGYKFNVVDSLITNFHLPESSLLMLVSAFAGKENIFNAYKYAIKNKMRFFSYGDAMIIKKCHSKS